MCFKTVCFKSVCLNPPISYLLGALQVDIVRQIFEFSSGLIFCRYPHWLISCGAIHTARVSTRSQRSNFTPYPSFRILSRENREIELIILQDLLGNDELL